MLVNVINLLGEDSMLVVTDSRTVSLVLLFVTFLACLMNLLILL